MAPTHTAVDAATLDTLLALDNQFCFALNAASRLVIRAYRPILRELGLTYPQYLVLLVLWEWRRVAHPRPTVHALGERLDLDSGTLTPLLKRLEAKRIIVRQRSTKDEREVLVRVTRMGASMRHKACQVPLTLLRNSPIPMTELIRLRDHLKHVRQVLVAHAARQSRP